MEVLKRHRRIQSGKLDGGVPKRDWILVDREKIFRPTPRYQRNDPPPKPAGKSLTHPYRLEQFIYMLNENGALKNGATRSERGLA